jgi:tyrosine-protein phosphatase SIW14
MKSGFRIASGLSVSLIVILAVSLSGNAAPPQTQQPPSTERSSQHSVPQKLTVDGVGDFAEVTPTLYRGGQPSRVGLEALAKMGVNIVVDARLSGSGNERKDVEKAGMQYVAIPWHCLFPKDDVFARFLAVLRDNPGKKVFVHCRYGDDRTGMMIAAYRMSVEGWTAEEALKEMDDFGFHHVVCHSLNEYERNFPEHLKQNPAFQAPSAQPAAN